MAENLDIRKLDRQRSIVELGSAVVMNAASLVIGAALYEKGNTDNLGSLAEAAIQNPQLSVPIGVLALGSIVQARASGRHSR